MIGEPIIGTYWREQYLEVKRQRDEARAEVERLRAAILVYDDAIDDDNLDDRYAEMLLAAGRGLEAT